MALTNAEKQRRYRARQREGARPVRYRRPEDRRSNPQRWRDAVADLVQLQERYGQWLENLPKSLHGSALGKKLRAIAAVDLDALQAVEPPLGFGRDRAGWVPKQRDRAPRR